MRLFLISRAIIARDLVVPLRADVFTGDTCARARAHTPREARPLERLPERLYGLSEIFNLHTLGCPGRFARDTPRHTARVEAGTCRFRKREREQVGRSLANRWRAEAVRSRVAMVTRAVATR